MPLRALPALRRARRRRVGGDVLRARLRLLALVRPAHAVRLARAARARHRSSAVVAGVWFAGPAAARRASCARGPRRGSSGSSSGRALRPLAPCCGPPWRRFGRPRRARRGARRRASLWHRLTPGELGLELTTLLALPAVGAFTFFAARRQRSTSTRCCRSTRWRSTSPTGSTPAWRRRRRRASCALGSSPGLRRRRARHGGLGAGPAPPGRTPSRWSAAFVADVLLVHVAKAAFDRPRAARPARRHRRRRRIRRRHAAYAVALDRVRGRARARRAPAGATRFAAVTAATRARVAVVAATRVYLRAALPHPTWSAGSRSATAVFGFAGVVALVVGFVRHNAARREQPDDRPTSWRAPPRGFADRVAGARRSCPPGRRYCAAARAARGRRAQRLRARRLRAGRARCSAAASSGTSTSSERIERPTGPRPRGDGLRCPCGRGSGPIGALARRSPTPSSPGSACPRSSAPPRARSTRRWC